MGINPFSTRISKHRKKLGYTKKIVANLVQCSETYIGNIENKGVVPEDEIVIRLAGALSLNERDLLLLAHKVKAPRGAKHYFEEPKPTFPLVRRFLLERCENQNIMAEEFLRASFSTLEKFVAKNVLVEPLMVYSGLRTDSGHRVESLEYLYDTVISHSPQSLDEYMSTYEDEFGGGGHGNSSEFVASAGDMFNSWHLDTEAFRLTVNSRYEFIKRNLSFARETLGQYIEYHRQKRGFGIEDVARRAQIVPEALKQIESDEYPLELKLETIGHILLALGIGQVPPGQPPPLEERYNANDYRLLETYKQLSDSSKKEIDSFMSYKLSEEDIADL